MHNVSFEATLRLDSKAESWTMNRITKALLRTSWSLRTGLILSLLACPLLADSPGAIEASAGNWPHWRGPTADGRADADAHPPTHWDAKTNIRWTVDLPGEGSSTPIVWGDQIFVLSAEATDRKAESPTIVDTADKTEPPDVFYRFTVTSVDRNSGQIRWQKVAAEQVPHEGKHQTHTYAAGSPTTDGQRLYASFGSRGIYAYTLSGELLWQVDLGDMQTRLGWGEAVTPVLAGDKLIVNWDEEKNSFITALDTRTGKQLWKVERPEEATSWNTPLVVEVGGRQLVIANGTHRAKAYEVETGKEVWACGGQTVNAIPSPLRFEDTVICMSGFRGAAAIAIPLDSQGDVTDSPKLRWKVDKGTPYVPSPALSGNRLFFTKGNEDILSCIDARTGQSLSAPKRLSGAKSIYSSPLVAGGHIYFAGREGTTIVIKDNATLDTVAENSLGETIDAAPIALGNQLFLRSWKKLVCIDSTTNATR